jgi:glyoxylase-like metal-dependent hydrolase (beta-lactamase superfamily II)/rhodanese-related sulfurtransferase
MPIHELNHAECKTWLAVSEKTREAVLIDPLLEHAGATLDLLKREGLKLLTVIDTHTHADHLSGAFYLREKTGVEVAMHPATRAAAAGRKLADGETISFGEMALTALHTPGHTTDSLSLAGNGALLTGDFLFLGSLGAGRLDLPGGDAAAHFASLEKIAGLKDDIEVLPGHDYQGRERSTLREERKSNPVLTPRKLDEYRAWWEARKMGPADWMKAVVKANLEGRMDATGVEIPQGVSACACAAPSEPVHGEAPAALAAADLQKMILEKRKLFLLDCREPREYNDQLGHIAGSALIPMGEVAARIDEIPQGTPIVSICRSGKRAAHIAQLLRAAGRPEVWLLTGGMIAWNQAGLPVERR